MNYELLYKRLVELVNEAGEVTIVESYDGYEVSAEGQQDTYSPVLADAIMKHFSYSKDEDRYGSGFEIENYG